MAPRPATISQADLSRLIRAARKGGAKSVKVSLTTGETAEFMLIEGENNSVEKSAAKIERRRRTML